MKGIKIIICLLIYHAALMAQSDFDSELRMLAEKVAIQIADSKKTRVAVWDFVSTQGEATNMGRYVAEDFSVYFTNAGKNKFSVMDRNHLAQLLKEHKLNSAGFIDPNTAKELGKINAVDAIITGTVDIFETKLKVRIKVLDTETALQIAAELGYLPVDENIASFLGVPGMGQPESANTASNRGFNSPVNPSEQYNNPGTVSKDCATKNTGDYYFENKTAHRVRVRGDAGYLSLLYLAPGETGAYFNIAAGKHHFQVNIWNNGERGDTIGMGEFLVEKCKSKTYLIRI